MGNREFDGLKVGGVIPCGVAYFDDMVMPYYHVGEGVIMYETYRKHSDGSYTHVPTRNPIAEKNLARNRARKLANSPDEALPRLAGGPGIVYNLNPDWKTALGVVGAMAIVGGCAFLGYIAGGLLGACAAGGRALQRVGHK